MINLIIVVVVLVLAFSAYKIYSIYLKKKIFGKKLSEVPLPTKEKKNDKMILCWSGDH